MNIADYEIDDKLIEATAADGMTRVAVYPYPHTSVVLGRGSNVEHETFADRIHEDGVELLRRRGGGCAVVLDPGNIVVSVVTRLPGLGGSKQAFVKISDWLIAALARLGVSGIVMRGVSDLAYADRKLGGSCIHRSRDLLYYSTTLMLRPQFTLIERYLPHPPREPDYRNGRRHGDFLCSLAELGVASDASDLSQQLRAVLPPLSLAETAAQDVRV